MTYDEQLQASRGVNDYTATKVVDDEIRRRIASYEPRMIECADVDVPRDEAVYTVRRHVSPERLFSGVHYDSSLPSFIWRSLNSVSFLVSSDTHGWITGTSPRNHCRINRINNTYGIQVNLITNTAWRRWGKDVELNRVAFAFTLTLNNKSLTLAVWENKSNANEWEVGPPGDYNTFFRELDAVPRKDDALVFLVSRLVQAMTGS